ncbi:MAG: hypothetical protein IPI73_26360 [Betaproteobacteria bacterium]|nr:hypothetical protein [Betaproteobacteria bacterium]
MYRLSSCELGLRTNGGAQGTQYRWRSRQGRPNALLLPKEIERHCRPDGEGDALLRRAITHLHLSARAYHRVLKVARTIADLAQSEVLAAGHVAEAVGYRRGMDRM